MKEFVHYHELLEALVLRREVSRKCYRATR